MALALWDAYTSLVAWFATGRIPILNVGCNDFTNTLLAAAFIRGNLPHRTHWWRAFIATLMVAMGGGTLNGILFGFTPGWLLNPRAFLGIWYAYLLAFHCPGDVFWKLYSRPSVRPLIDVLKGLALVQSIGGTIDMLASSPKLGDTLLKNGAWHSFLLAGVFGGAGGLMWAEYFNVLLLPPQQLRNPGPYGPGGGFYACVINSLLYTFIIRNPAQLPYAATWNSAEAAILSLPMPAWAYDWACIVTGLAGTFTQLPLARDQRSAQAVLSLFTIAFQSNLLLGPATAQRLGASALSLIPGWRNVLVPSAIGTAAASSAKSLVGGASGGGGASKSAAAPVVPIRPPGDIELFGYVRLPNWTGDVSPVAVPTGTSAGGSGLGSLTNGIESLGRQDGGRRRSTAKKKATTNGAHPSTSSSSASATDTSTNNPTETDIASLPDEDEAPEGEPAHALDSTLGGISAISSSSRIGNGRAAVPSGFDASFRSGSGEQQLRPTPAAAAVSPKSSSPKEPFRPPAPTVVTSPSGGGAVRRRSVSLSPTGRYLPLQSPSPRGNIGAGSSGSRAEVSLLAATLPAVPVPNMRTKAGGVTGKAATVVPAAAAAATSPAAAGGRAVAGGVAKKGRSNR